MFIKWNEGFVFISVPYMVKFTENAYEVRLRFELGNVNLNKETGIYK